MTLSSWFGYEPVKAFFMGIFCGIFAAINKDHTTGYAKISLDFFNPKSINPNQEPTGMRLLKWFFF